MYKVFGRMGIFFWIVIATILANIQVVKIIPLFGLEASLGNIMYGTIFLGTDVLNEIYGKKDAKKAVFLGFLVMLLALPIMQIALWFTPHELDTAQSALETIFGFAPEIVIGSMSAFIVSQTFDVYIFQWIKKKLPQDKFLWIRNNGSTIVSQLIDTLIFVPIAFVLSGYLSLHDAFGIFLSTYLIKLLVAILDTPFIYLVKKIKPNELK
jgi:uncharacterized integral membrane protein (TIGR00697 family)